MMKLAIILATLSAMFWPGPSIGSREVQRTYASHDGLTLALDVRISGPIVIAQAKLTNTSSHPLEYYGGCAPPVLQIQARDAGGHHVFGWVPPRVNCLALSPRQLASGASIRESGRFPILGLTRVRAAVQVKVGRVYLFQTRPLNVTPR